MESYKMDRKKLADLTDEELLQEEIRIKPFKLYDAIIFGVLIGIATYKTLKNGLGLLTFLPLIYLPIAANNKAKSIALQKLLKDRGLK
ncbi:FUSC family protein [Mesonia sp. MT50]|uniref:FUSC family protein n=2 Tax=Mesonia TaxID=232115 RepID=A0ABU1A2Y4_9FLAO|nr:FUSC family protein [Mesonia profundi]MDQ7918062.1 FUSC family protein [Mesonia profundi]